MKEHLNPHWLEGIILFVVIYWAVLWAILFFIYWKLRKRYKNLLMIAGSFILYETIHWTTIFLSDFVW